MGRTYPLLVEAEVALEFGILGITSIVNDVGEAVALSSPQARAVLAVLLLNPNAVVSMNTLIDTLWPGTGDDDSPPKSATNVVQQLIHRLRTTLGDSKGIIETRHPGYLIRIDAGHIDFHRFRDLVSEATAESDAHRRVELLREALRKWRGEALADVDCPALANLRVRIEKERLQALVECVACELELGQHKDVLAELRESTDRYPLEERLQCQLILAEYRCTGQAAALAAYDRYRNILEVEVSAAPGHEAAKLRSRVLADDPALLSTAATRAEHTGRTNPGADAGVPVPRQLPAAPPGFAGRTAELAKLTTALDNAADAGDSAAVCAIAGAGGIGKTWLALQWAYQNLHRFPDGQLFVDLCGFSPEGQPLSAGAAIRGFLDALGVDLTGIPIELDAQAAQLRSLIATRRMLIVLDNALDATQVTPLLPGGCTVTVLVTSRAHLTGLITRHGARHMEIDVLAEPEAEALLAKRLGTERLADERDAVDDLLDCCAGFPLALSIIAGRAHTHPQLTLTALAAELRDARLDTLDDVDPVASLPAVLSWSYGALTDEQASMFGQLGMAPGPDTSLEAAASLSGLPAARAQPILRGLIRVSLLDQTRTGRYRMHDLIGAYAAGQAESDQPASARQTALQRVTGFYLHTAFAADRLLHPPRPSIDVGAPPPGCHPLPLSDRTAALEWFETEHRCLLATQQAAAAQGWHQAAWQLAWVMHTFHHRRGYRHDHLASWKVGQAAADRLDEPITRSLAYRLLGGATARAGAHDEALALFQQALTLAEQAEDLASQAHTHQILGWALAQRGDCRLALAHSTHALRLFRALGNPAWEAEALNAVGWYATQLGDHARAHSSCMAALALTRTHHDRDGEAATLDSLGYIAQRTGCHDEAIDYYQQARTLLRHLGNTYAQPSTLDRLGRSYEVAGRRDEARAAWREALRLYQAQQRYDAADLILEQLDRTRT
jgi:DNA-binding SARP family transcriptional activator/tetratricopeptide (TPR) repeat protein